MAISSVSRVLNGHTSNRETIERVQRAVREVGYVPSAVAQSLKTQHTGQVAFAMEDVGNAAYLAMIRAIQPVLRESGYRLLLHSTGGDVADEIEVLESLSQRYVDGLILCPIRVTDQHLEALAHPAVPVVVIGSLPDDVPVDNVRADSRRDPVGPATWATRMRSPRRILPSGQSSCRSPTSPSRRALRPPPRSSGFSRVQTRSSPRTTCSQTCKRSARQVWPPRPSVSLGAAERGRLAAELLLERLADQERAPQRATVPPRLVVRASTGRASAGPTRSKISRPGSAGR